MGRTDALKNMRYLTRQQIRTLRGQILAGYEDDSMRGMARLLAKERQNVERKEMCIEKPEVK